MDTIAETLIAENKAEWRAEGLAEGLAKGQRKRSSSFSSGVLARSRRTSRGEF